MKEMSSVGVIQREIPLECNKTLYTFINNSSNKTNFSLSNSNILNPI